jgi:hypothetical protein
MRAKCPPVVCPLFWQHILKRAGVGLDLGVEPGTDRGRLVLVLWTFSESKREPGESRNAREPEDLPASGMGETTCAGSTWKSRGRSVGLSWFGFSLLSPFSFTTNSLTWF